MLASCETADGDDDEEDGSSDAEASGTDDGLTDLLNAAAAGDRAAQNEVFEKLYDDFRGMAAPHARGTGEWKTGLVGEMYQRLFGRSGRGWKNRKHFFAVVRKALRSIVLDRLREQGRQKRTPPGSREDPERAPDPRADFVRRLLWEIDFSEKLQRLRETDPLAARVAQLRIVEERSIADVADVTGLSVRKVERLWQFVRLWFAREMP